jgi:hypothetical protein
MLYNVLKMPLKFDNNFDDYFPEEEDIILSISKTVEINNLEETFTPIPDTPRTIQNSNPFYINFFLHNKIKLQSPFKMKSCLFQTQ